MYRGLTRSAILSPFSSLFYQKHDFCEVTLSLLKLPDVMTHQQKVREEGVELLLWEVWSYVGMQSRKMSWKISQASFCCINCCFSTTLVIFSSTDGKMSKSFSEKSLQVMPILSHLLTHPICFIRCLCCNWITVQLIDQRIIAITYRKGKKKNNFNLKQLLLDNFSLGLSNLFVWLMLQWVVISSKPGILLDSLLYTLYNKCH